VGYLAGELVSPRALPLVAEFSPAGYGQAGPDPLTKARYMPSSFCSLFWTALEKDRNGKALEQISLSTLVDDYLKHCKYATGSPFL